MAIAKSSPFVETWTFSPLSIVSAALNSTRQQIVAISRNPVRCLFWDLKTCKPLPDIVVEDPGYTFIDLDPHGEIAFGRKEDGFAAAWDIYTGEILCHFQAHSKHDRAYIISANHKTIVGRDSDRGWVKAWDAQTGNEIFSRQMPRSLVTCAAIARDGRTLIMANSSIEDGGSIEIWDLETGQEQGRIIASERKGAIMMENMGVSEHSARYGNIYDWGVRALHLTDGDRILLACMKDGTVQVYELTSRTLLKTLSIGYKSYGQSNAAKIAVCPDGRTLFALGKFNSSAHNNLAINVWDIDTGKLTREITCHHTSMAYDLAIDSQGRYLLLVGGKTGILDWRKKKVFELPTGHGDFVNAVAVVSDRQEVISGDRDATVRVWDLKTGKNRLTFTQHLQSLRRVIPSPDGKSIVSVDSRGIGHIWNLRTGKLIRTLAGKIGGQFAISPDGRTMAGSSICTHPTHPKRIHLWQFRTGRMIQTIEGLEHLPQWFAFHPDGRTLVSSSNTINNENTIHIWDLKTLQPRQTIAAAGQLTISADGHLLVSCNRSLLQVWNLHTGENLHTLPTHNATAIAISPDLRVVALGMQRNYSVKLLDLQTGETLADLPGHTKHITGLAFSQNGQILVSGSHDRSVRVWQCRS